LDKTKLSKADLDQLGERRIKPAEIERQLELYRNPPPSADLVRSCTTDDGIRVLSDAACERYAVEYDEACHSRSVVKFVPASGAASRMFRSLSAVLADENTATRRQLDDRARHGDDDAADCVQFLDGLDRLACRDDLVDVLSTAGVDWGDAVGGDRFRDLLRAALSEDVLGYASRAKGLLPFHRYPEGVRTAVDEHLVEAAHYARGEADTCRLHFTVSPAHREAFRVHLDTARPRFEARLPVRYEFEFSIQEPSTDTLAVSADNEPFRDGDGRLLFRPGGHGALIGNLGRIDADLVFIKNIDNVAADPFKAPTYLWKRALGGVLIELQERVFHHLHAIDVGKGARAVTDAALAFLEEHFHVRPPAAVADADSLRAFLVDQLDRPLRVCGMVRNEGDPGGGPFWVRDRWGRTSPQIVETSQIDLESREQQGIHASATHFNPVDLVCATRDWHGRTYDLSRFVDETAVFIAEKSHGGRPLKSLELPGLWNGAMAGWNTVFVEVPITTFNPVKSIIDLFREAHLPVGR
jgi:hypothetical protein